MIMKEKAMLKVLIKCILLENKSKRYTARKLAEIINDGNYGFKSSITSKSIGKLLSKELNKGEGHFMDEIKYECAYNVKAYYID